MANTRSNTRANTRANTMALFWYTFWSSVSTVSANSLHEAVVDDIHVVDQYLEFIGKLNKVWSSSQQSVRKIPANRAVGVSRLVLERLEEELGSRVVDCGELVELRKRYETLLADSKEGKKREVSLMRELKGLKAVVLRVKRSARGSAKGSAKGSAIAEGNGNDNDNDNDNSKENSKANSKANSKENALGISLGLGNADMMAFLEQIKKTLQYSRRFIPLSGMANEYFTGMQLVEAAKKLSPGSVWSMYQQERFGQWLMDEGYMMHHNDILRLRKTFSVDGYYCWQMKTNKNKNKVHEDMEPFVSRSEACNVMWEQWSKYSIKRLEFETWHMACMGQLGELREKLVDVVGKLEEVLGGNRSSSSSSCNITMESLYARNMGSIGFYVTMNEPLVKPGANPGDIPEDSPLEIGERDDEVEKSGLWVVLDSLEQEDAVEVRKWWDTEFDLVHWHRVREDIQRKWWGYDAEWESFVVGLPVEKRVCVVKGILIEMGESIVPGRVVERSLREEQSLRKSLGECKVGRTTLKVLAKLAGSPAFAGAMAEAEAMTEAEAKGEPQGFAQGFPQGLAQDKRIPLVHFFMRCQHQVPQKLAVLERLWWEFVGDLEGLLEEAVEESVDEPGAAPAPQVPIVSVTRSRSSSRASSASAAGASPHPPLPPVSPKRGHVTDTQFIPKPFKSSRPASYSGPDSTSTSTGQGPGSGQALGSSSGTNSATSSGSSSGTSSREKRRSGTPLVHILG